MPKELIALAGDLVAERKRLSESLRRFESTLMRSLGTDTSEAMMGELDSFARSLDRLGALTKTLVHFANADRLEPCEPLLADAVLAIESVAASLDRPVVIDCKSNEVKIDRELLMKFRPIFIEMLETLVEYCVETPKERLARKKRPKAFFQIDVKPFEAGYRVLVVCDGNGILPPLVSDHGLRLAEIGVRAGFEGRPGQWSSWRFHIPTSTDSFHSVPVRVGDRKLCIPSWAVVSTRPLDLAARAAGKAWAVGEGLERREIDLGGVSGTGQMLCEIAAGTHTVTYLFDEVLEPEEGFLKQLSEAFSGQGRFIGVVISESSDSGGAMREELCLVVNPAYLVYGGAGEQTSQPELAPERAGEAEHAL